MGNSTILALLSFRNIWFTRPLHFSSISHTSYAQLKKALLFSFELTGFCNHCLKHHCILSTISKNLYLKLWLVRRVAVSCLSLLFFIILIVC